MKNNYFVTKMAGVLLALLTINSASIAQEGRLPTKEEMAIKMNLEKIYSSSSLRTFSNHPNHLMVTGPEQDCDNSVPVCQQTYTQSNSYTGYGTIQEVSGTCLTAQETNSVWYTFTVQNSGTFTFMLNTANDYDFAMYDITTIGCVGVPSATPVRCNFSATYGNTGLTLPASAVIPISIGAGGAPTMAGLNVTAGQTFALIIDNYSANSNGYTLTFGGTAQIFDIVAPVLGTLTHACNSNSANLTFSEPVQCGSILANGTDFIITGPGALNVPVTGATGNLCSTGASFTNFATLNFNASGLPTGVYTVSVQNGTDGNTIIDKCGNTMSTAQSATFQILAPITLSANNPVVCSGGPSTITAIGATGVSGVGYSWSPISGTYDSLQVNPTATNTYTATATYGGCSQSASTTITVSQPPVVTVNPANVSLCSGTTNISAAATINGAPCSNCNYVWTGSAAQTDNGVASSTVTGAGVGTYNVSISSGAGCIGNTATSVVSILSPTSPPSCDIVYASPAGGGTGLAPSSPTTIQIALTMAACNSIVIKMQIGDYPINNPLTVGSFVTIEGGYNVGFTLKTSGKAIAGGWPVQGTRIIRSTSNPEGSAGNLRLTALNVTSGSSYFRFQDVMILVNNATGGTKTSNYGIYLGATCHDYNIVRCLIDAGTGSAGTNGTVTGINGGPGSSANTILTPWTTGGIGGVGAFAGGTGGNGSTGANNNTAGSNGLGFSPGTGGAKALGGDQADCGTSSADGFLYIDVPACNAGNGINGGAGANGGTGLTGAVSAFGGGYFSIGGDGAIGSIGIGGSGGGGAGGGNRNTSTCDGPNNGAGGEGGGGGGYPGTGGTGGTAAGGAFGIFSVTKGANTSVLDCNINALVGTPGTGASGGIGGNGGLGLGGIVIGTTNGWQYGGASGSSGSGGKGGNGGQGGAGASGQLCLVCDVNGATLTIDAAFSNYALTGQPVITVDNIACSNINIDHSTTAGSPTWTTFGSGSSPASGSGSPSGTQYSTLGRKDIVMNANTYTGFNNILVNVPSTGSILSSTLALCPGVAQFGASAAGTPGFTYAWSVFPAATIGTATLDTTSITFPNAGAVAITYTVTLTINSQCCGQLTPLTQSITVYPIPPAPAATVDPVCLGGTTTFTATSPLGASFTWLDAASSGNILGMANTYTSGNLVAAGAYTVYLQATNNGGCSGTITPVSVTPTAILPPTGVSAISCDTGIVFVDINPVSGVTNYNWYSDIAGTILVQSGSSLNYGQNIGTTGGTYTVYVQSDLAGCTPSSLVAVTGSVSAFPIDLSQTFSPNDTVCINTAVTITLTPTGGNGVFSYSWSPVVSASNSITQSVSASTAYYVTISSDGCSKLFNLPIIVKPYPFDSIAPVSDITCTSTIINLDGSGSESGADITYGWTTSGGNFTSGVNSNTATADAAGTYTLTVTDNTTGCASTNSVTVNLNNTIPTITASSNNDINCLTPNATLTGSSPGNAMVWNGGSLVNAPDPATVAAAATYTVTATDASNGCVNTFSVTVNGNTILPAITASTNNDITCLTPNAILSGNSPGNTMIWNGGSLLNAPDPATVTAAGTYTVTATDVSNGCTNTFPVTVNANTTLPVVTASSNNDITCLTPSAILSGNSPGNGMVWNGGSLVNEPNPATVTAAGSYTVTATDISNGCSDTFPVTVNLNTTLPTVTASSNNDIDCLTPSAILTGSSTGNAMVWNGGSLVNTPDPATVTAAGTYTVTATDASNGCTNTFPVTVNLNTTLPTVTASSNNDLDCLTPSTILTGSSTGNVMVWNGGSLINAPDPATVTAAGTYTVTATDASNGCTNTFPVTVNSNTTLPAITASSSNDITCLTLSATLTGSSAGNTMVWNGGALINAPDPATVTTAGTYTVTATDASNGCTNTFPVTVNLNTTLPTLTASSNNDITCSTPSALLSGNSIGNGMVWNGGSLINAADPATVTAAGTYIVTATDANNGCTNTFPVTVNLNTTLPTVTASSNNDITCFTPSALLSGNSAGNGMVWNGGSLINAADPATITAAGTYTVTATGAINGCSNTFSVTVNANTTIPIVGASYNNDITCFTPISTLTGSSLGNVMVWNGGSLINAPDPAAVTTAGTYTVTATDPINGCANTFPVTINSNTTLPIVTASSNNDLTCLTPSAILSGNSFGNGMVWNGGSLINAPDPATVTTAGTFTVTATDAINGCTNTSTVTVVSIPDPIASFTASPLTGLPPFTVDVINNSQNADTYSWNFGNGTTSVLPSPPGEIYSNAGTYTITLIVSHSNSNCPDTTRETIIVKDNFSLIIPNVFSPNHDDKNDLFSVISTGVEELNATIYDRWGLKLFEWNTVKGGWDGRSSSGVIASDGTYYYIMKITDNSGKEYLEKGSFTLIK